MSNLISIAKERALRLISRKPYYETSENIQNIIEKIKKINFQDISILNQTIDALIFAKRRLKEQLEIQSQIKANKVRKLNYNEELEAINNSMQKQNENISKLNGLIIQSISILTSKIIAINEEVNEIIIYIGKYDNYYLTNLNQKLTEQNEIVKKTKIKQNYKEENTKIELKQILIELNNLSMILKSMQNYSHIFETNEIIQLKK